MQILEQIIEAWPTLAVVDDGALWKLTEVDQSRMVSRCPDLWGPCYVLTLRYDRQPHPRSHCLLEVTFRDFEYISAVSFPPFVNSYVVLEMMHTSFGHILEQNCRILLNGTLLTEELVECNTGSFFQLDVFAVASERVAVDLRQMLERYLPTVHLPLSTVPMEHYPLRLFIPRGGTCFSGAVITCQSSFENWHAALVKATCLAMPVKDPDMLCFYRVHHSFEQVQPHDDRTFFYIQCERGGLDDDTRVIVVTVCMRGSMTTGACYWPSSTSIWRLFDLCQNGKPWTVYHNNQKMGHRNVLVNNGDYFVCYEKTPALLDLIDASNQAELDMQGQFGRGVESLPRSDRVGFTSVRPLVSSSSSGFTGGDVPGHRIGKKTARSVGQTPHEVSPFGNAALGQCPPSSNAGAAPVIPPRADRHDNAERLSDYEPPPPSRRSSFVSPFQ